MPTNLDEDQTKQLTDWIAQNGSAAVDSPQPKTPANPALAPTNRGAAEEDTGTLGNDERIQDPHPGHQPQDLATYAKGQEAQLDKYGPDQEKAVMDSIMKSQGSFGNRAALGAAGLGDAIMSVAGKSSPGFLNSLENRESNQNKMALESIPQLQGMQEKKMAQQRALDEINPSSPLNASVANAYAPFFRHMGVPEADITKMLKNPTAAKALLEPYAAVASKEEQLQIQTMLKQLELAQQNKQLQATTAKQNADVQHQKTQEDLEKKKFEADHPIRSFFSNLGKQNPDATGGGSFDHASIPSGNTYKAPDGTTRRKR